MCKTCYSIEQHNWPIVHFVLKVWNFAHSIYLPWGVLWDMELSQIWPLNIIYSLFYDQNSDFCLYLTYATLNLFKFNTKFKTLIYETSQHFLKVHSMFLKLWYFTSSKVTCITRKEIIQYSYEFYKQSNV